MNKITKMLFVTLVVLLLTAIPPAYAEQCPSVDKGLAKCESLCKSEKGCISIQYRMEKKECVLTYKKGNEGQVQKKSCTFIIKDSSGKPVQPTQPPVVGQQCSDPNARFSNCASHCPQFCGMPPTVCIKMCRVGCECRKGYVRRTNSLMAQCIPANQCPSTVCQLPLLTGPCKPLKYRVGFNTTTQQCQEFYYGGCKGNENQFPSFTECVHNCQPELLKPKKNKVCELPLVTGMCKAAFPKFGFNTATQRCQKFTYGGCGGNSNRFESKEKCGAACEPTFVMPACNLPIKPVLCAHVTANTTAMPGYSSYDTTTKKCRVFAGCAGNANRFATWKSCEEACMSGRKMSFEML